MFNITSSWTNVIPTEQFHGGVTSSVVRNTLRFPKKEPSLKYLFHWCCYVSHNPASIISRLFVKVFPTLVYSPFSLLCLWWCCYAKHNLILNKCNSNIEVLPHQWFLTHWRFRRKIPSLNTFFSKKIFEFGEKTSIFGKKNFFWKSSNLAKKHRIWRKNINFWQKIFLMMMLCQT